MQETITVTGESPIVDTKDTGTKQTFTNELLQSIPSARDPWVILQQTAGIAMDRENVGGNMSGQQSNYVSRGGNPTNNKWSLDGVDITDMAATGASPSYYDFDAFEEMTITTGGVDVTQQTGGVGINLVTKSGSDRFKGSSRFYVTDEKFESQNVTDALRRRAPPRATRFRTSRTTASSSAARSRRARPGSGAASASRPSTSASSASSSRPPACQAFKTTAVALAASIDTVNDCLNTDRTLLQTTNLKAEVQLFKGNKLTLFNNFAKKERNARGAERPEPDRNDDAAGRGDAALRQALVEHRPEPDLQVRRPVGGQRPPAPRRAVRARRQQLHRSTSTRPNWPTCSRRSSSRPA